MQRWIYAILMMTVAAFSLLITACGGSDDDKDSNNSSDNPIENSYTYYLGFYTDALDTDIVMIHTDGDNLPDCSLTFNGQPIALSESANIFMGVVPYTAGQTCSGVLTIGGQTFNYNVTLVHRLSDVVETGEATTPTLTWTLAGNNQFQAVQGSWYSEEDDGELFKSISTSARTYTFPNHTYEDYGIVEMNYQGYGSSLLVYSMNMYDNIADTRELSPQEMLQSGQNILKHIH